MWISKEGESGYNNIYMMFLCLCFSRLQGANILLNDQGEVKLGGFLLCSAVVKLSLSSFIFGVSLKLIYMLLTEGTGLCSVYNWLLFVLFTTKVMIMLFSLIID